MIASLALALSVSAAALEPPPSTAFLTYESGVLVAVDWIDRRGETLHTRSILTQSRVLDATIKLRSDGTAARSSATISVAGETPGPPIVRDLGEGAIYWSGMIASSLEQAIQRARALNLPTVRLPAASLFRDARYEVLVERRDATDWVVTWRDIQYVALIDERGNLLAATLPAYGVTIERRTHFALGDYPLWPPNTAPPDSAYRAEQVRIPAPLGHVLAGTLTVPPGAGPFPAAVLITGLSPHNRNNGDPPWMPLRDLADALTRRGIAALRVDDRGIGESTGEHDSSTTFDEANDVWTEVAWLRAQGRIDPRRVALVGYSEGGLIAPMVAAGDSTIAAIVTLAGPGVSGPEVARYQIEAAVVRDSSISAADREAEIQKRLDEPLNPRERSYMGIDPLSYARRVRCPALILQGGSDLTVPPRSAERLATAMRVGGNRDATVRVFPGISHAFLPDPGGLNDGWVYLPAFLTAPEVLGALGEWSAERLRAPTR